MSTGLDNWDVMENRLVFRRLLDSVIRSYSPSIFLLLVHSKARGECFEMV